MARPGIDSTSELNQHDAVGRKKLVELGMQANDQESDAIDGGPNASMSVYSTPEPNSPVILYEGDIDTGQIDIASGANAPSLHGRIILSWLPRYGVTFDVQARGATIAALDSEVNTIDLGLVGLGIKATGLFTNVNFGDGSGGSYSSISGRVSEFISPLTNGLSKVVFHLPNFAQYFGERIHYPGNRIGRGRLRLEAGGWHIVMEEVDMAINKVKASGGFIFTHVGQVTRSDGVSFASDEVSPVLEALTYLCWFTCGRHTSPILAVGIGANGERIWEDWRQLRQNRWDDTLSWFPENSPQALSVIFPSLLRIVLEKTWYEPLKLAISWYVQSLDAGSLESGIILAQVGLELLAWVEMVEKRGVMSKDGFDKLTTTDKMRLFFSWAHIPLALPVELEALKSLADSTQGKNRWSDGPEALVEFRNSITHAKRRDTAYSSPPEARWEALKLARWYLELSILHVLDYQGVYTCRIRENLHRGQEELVPWAK